MKNNLVSIVIPCYNDDATVRRAVEFALNQTYSLVEVIVVDDGSNQKTKKVLASLVPKITLISQQNRGPSAARNEGIRQSKGMYILPLDSDDYFNTTFCEKAVAALEADLESKIVTSQALVYPLGAQPVKFTPLGGTIMDYLYRNGALGTSMFRKSEWQAIGGYDETMRQGWEDWEFYIRLLQDGGKTTVLNEPLYHYFRGTDRTTAVANANKYDLMRYFYLKHRELYIADYDNFVNHIINLLASHQSSNGTVSGKPFGKMIDQLRKSYDEELAKKNFVMFTV